MKLQKIEWRNIGPFGNKLQSIELPSEGGLWMVTGKNGNGKSFFVNLPKILYYGKLDKFKKDEIANRMNKHGWIRGFDETSPENHVMIERNFSPSNLYVEKNKEDIGKAGITDYQSYIDLEVTGLPYHIFSNIISLSINDFKSFISMTPHDKRVIIDKLFAMEIINKMNELVKKDLREVKTNMDVFDRDILSLKNNIDVAVNELQKLTTQVKEDNSVKVLELAHKLETYKPKLKEGYDKKKIYEDKRASINSSYDLFLRQKLKVQGDIQQLNHQISLFDKDMCPTCSTPFSDSRFDLIRGQLQEDINKKKDELQAISTDENKYNTALKKINEGLTTIDNFIIQIKSTYKAIESEMEKLKMDKPKEFKSIQNIISDSTTLLTTKSIKKAEFDNDYKYLDILEEMYSESGVKKKILKNYIPTLNKELAFTLHELHFPYNLTFNADFEPELFHLGIKIGVDTLCTGEKKRVDLAVLISIIKMLKGKYPGLNIFMLDEVLSSVDGDGIYDITGLLQKIAKEMRMNIFVINHAPLPIEQFDFRIEISKNAGFSDLVIKKLNEGD